MTGEKILLIEDDAGLADSLTAYLASEGFVVKHASTLLEAKQLDPALFQLVLLDWQLPDGRGIDLLRDWRDKGCKQPIILLTAKAHLADKVLGLELGADDYLTKPFEPLELVARMRVRLRSLVKTPTCEINYYEIQGIKIDSHSRQVTYQESPVNLAKLEFDLLLHFVQHPGKVFSREELLNTIWGFENFPTTRTIDTHILQLRQKFHPDFFETVRGIGYRFKV